MTGRAKPAVDSMAVRPRTGTDYPPPLDALCNKREQRVLGDLFGLSQFGVNLVRLPPGQASAQRHWHRHEDEFVMVLQGTLALVIDAGEQAVGPGMVAGFPAGVADGHHLVNRSDEDAVYLEIGKRAALEECFYPDIDLHYGPGDEAGYSRKDGTPY